MILHFLQMQLGITFNKLHLEQTFLYYYVRKTTIPDFLSHRHVYIPAVITKCSLMGITSLIYGRTLKIGVVKNMFSKAVDT